MIGIHSNAKNTTRVPFHFKKMSNFFEGLALEFSTSPDKISGLPFLKLDLPSVMRRKPGGTFGKFILLCGCGEEES